MEINKTFFYINAQMKNLVALFIVGGALSLQVTRSSSVLDDPYMVSNLSLS